MNLRFLLPRGILPAVLLRNERDVNTQAVFSLRGKPLNSYGLTKKIVYENEEFNLLQAALNIENGLEELRYNNVIIATDADVDGMHIRLVVTDLFLAIFPGFGTVRTRLYFADAFVPGTE